VLAARGFAGLTVNAVVAEAGMAKGSFYTHFSDRESFLLELGRGFHHQMVSVVLAAITDLPSGPDRFRAGLDAYFDACLGQRAAVALIFEARVFVDIDLEREVTAGQTELGRRGFEDLEAVGWRNIPAIMVLITAAGMEVVREEARAGHPRRDLREALFDLAMARRDPS
jgi:AcrR family transcriptional regulator